MSIDTADRDYNTDQEGEEDGGFVSIADTAPSTQRPKLSLPLLILLDSRQVLAQSTALARKSPLRLGTSQSPKKRTNSELQTPEDNPHRYAKRGYTPLLVWCMDSPVKGRSKGLDLDYKELENSEDKRTVTRSIEFFLRLTLKLIKAKKRGRKARKPLQMRKRSINLLDKLLKELRSASARISNKLN